MENVNNKIITISVNRKLNDNIENCVNNKSKLTEWLLIRYLEQNGVDVIKKINF